MQMHETAQGAPGLARRGLENIVRRMQNHARYACMAF
ncbi:acetyl xylan esterase [Edwardsiella anguillarum]|nr:acetyl xylan esterase [Edwardsiella anguillarum]